jgi:hypothetical protein
MSKADPKEDKNAEVAQQVFNMLQTNIKHVLAEPEVVKNVFNELDRQIRRILTRNTPTQPYKIATPLDRIRQQPLDRWNFKSGSSSGGFSGSIANYGRQAFNSIRNAFSTIFKPRTPIVPTTPFQFTPYTGSENIVQLEVQSRTGNNTIKKLGLYGLKKLGDAFEPIQPSAASKPYDKFVPDSDEPDQGREV